MPAKSQAQRAYLASHFGIGWMRETAPENPGQLPRWLRKKIKKKSERMRKNERWS